MGNGDAGKPYYYHPYKGTTLDRPESKPETNEDKKFNNQMMVNLKMFKGGMEKAKEFILARLDLGDFDIGSYIDASLKLLQVGYDEPESWTYDMYLAWGC